MQHVLSPGHFSHTDGSLRHLLPLHLALLLPLLRLYPPLQREQGAGVCHLLRVSEPFMYCGSPNLPQTRKSSLKLNDTGDNGHIADGAQLTKQICVLLHLLIVVVPCYPQVIFPTLMVLSATYCTCISLSYCPSSGYVA
jgi:hypothetical protein